MKIINNRNFINRFDDYKRLKKQKLNTEKLEVRTVFKTLKDFAIHDHDCYKFENKPMPCNKKLIDKARSTKEFMRDYGLDHLSYYFKSQIKKDGLPRDILNQPELCSDAVSMCIDVYANKSRKINGWKPIRAVRNSENGFDANVYKKGNKIVIAYGATNDPKDICTDIKMSKKGGASLSV